MWILKVIDCFMPSYIETDEDHRVHFSWDSPCNGILYINKIVGNAQGDSIKTLDFFGKFNGQQGLADLYLEIFANTAIWRDLYFRFSD